MKYEPHLTKQLPPENLHNDCGKTKQCQKMHPEKSQERHIKIYSQYKVCCQPCIRFVFDVFFWDWFRMVSNEKNSIKFICFKSIIYCQRFGGTLMINCSKIFSKLTKLFYLREKLVLVVCFPILKHASILNVEGIELSGAVSVSTSAGIFWNCRILVEVWFTTSKGTLNIYYKKLCLRGDYQVAEWLTWILGNSEILEISKMGKGRI